MEIVKLDGRILGRILPRKADSHKGEFGTLTALCGSETMPGAAYLSALGALRSGVGLLQLAVPDGILPILQAKLAEPVWLSPDDLPDTRETAFLCGPGLGRASDDLLARLLPEMDVPAVYDADCINFLAKHKDVMDRLSHPFILTPHEMEFSRLTGIPAEEIHKNRAEAALEYAVKHSCFVVLKGHGTVVASPEGQIFVNTTGSSTLAKGGSGDVLAGVIASLLAQGHDPLSSALLGVYAHGLAGDRLAKVYGVHGVLPSDLPAEIGRILG